LRFSFLPRSRSLFPQVRTSGKPGEHKGISFLVIPRTKGVSTKAMKMQSAGSGTTIFEMDDVHVPVENLVGKEGEGFKYIVSAAAAKRKDRKLTQVGRADVQLQVRLHCRSAATSAC